MSDKQLEEYFAPYLHTTRPELAPKPEPKRVATSSAKPAIDKAKLREMAQKLGIPLNI